MLGETTTARQGRNQKPNLIQAISLTSPSAFVRTVLKSFQKFLNQLTKTHCEIQATRQNPIVIRLVVPFQDRYFQPRQTVSRIRIVPLATLVLRTVIPDGF